MAPRYRVRVDVRKPSGEGFYFGNNHRARRIPASMVVEIVGRITRKLTEDEMIFVGDDTYVRASEIIAVWVEDVEGED